MLELTRGPAPCPEVHRSRCKRVFPACVNPGLHLVEWTRYIVDLSYFVAAHTVHSSSCRLQLASQLISLTSSVIKMIQPMGNFLNCAMLIIGQTSRAKIKFKNTINRLIETFYDIPQTCQSGLRSDYWLAPYAQKFAKHMNRHSRADSRTCPLARTTP